MLSGLLLTAAHGDAPLRTSQLHSLFWQKFHFLFLLVMIFSFLSCAGCVFLPFRLALSLTVNAAFLPALTLLPTAFSSASLPGAPTWIALVQGVTYIPSGSTAHPPKARS